MAGSQKEENSAGAGERLQHGDAAQAIKAIDGGKNRTKDSGDEGDGYAKRTKKHRDL